MHIGIPIILLQLHAHIQVVLAMDMFQPRHCLLGAEQVTVVTLDTDYLDQVVVLVSRQEAGVAHNQIASVSERLYTPPMFAYHLLSLLFSGVCPPLRSPRYGRVSVNTYDVGGIATYSCNTGYGLSGYGRTCSSSGRWSGLEPTCEGEQLVPSLITDYYNQNCFSEFHSSCVSSPESSQFWFLVCLIFVCGG